LKIRNYLFAAIAVFRCTNVLGAAENFYSEIIRLDNCTQKIHQNYVDSIHAAELVNAAIDGMLTMLDDNSMYFINDKPDLPVRNSSDSAQALDNHHFLGMMNGTIAYTWFEYVTEKTSKELETFLEKKRTTPASAIILDLRECRGGIFSECIGIASMFLHKGYVIASTKSRVRGQNNEYKSRSKPIVPDSIPVLVLISGQTVSGAELIAASLQYHERAILVGDTTAAVGRVGSILPLDNEHRLKLTTALFYSPAGKCIDKSGFNKDANYRTFRQREIASVPGVVPDFEAVSVKSRSIIRALKELQYFDTFIKNYNSTGIKSDSRVVFEKFREFVIERSEKVYNSDSTYRLFAPSVLMKRIAEYDNNLSDQMNVALLHMQRTFLLEQIDSNRQDIENELNKYLWRSGNLKTVSEKIEVPESDHCLQKALSLLQSKQEIWKILKK
jgi:hypothetical protein